MTTLEFEWDGEVGLGTVLGNLPITVGVFALIAWYFATNNVYITDVPATARLNPINLLLNMFLHVAWWHFRGNMEAWIPFGIVLTWLTSNRHVFGVVVVSHLLASVVGLLLGRFGIGMSVAVFALIAATLVRSVGAAFQNASMESLQAAIMGVLVPLVGALFFLALVGWHSRIGHFLHFLGFLFGGAIEAMFVFGGHDRDTDERTIPRRFGR
ncbi:MAG: rhomboid family intramembrane serine protease [Halorientalis sp.]